MATTVGTETDLESLLTDLIQLDFDAADAYQAAIDRLENHEWRAMLASFKEDHLRHTAELGEALRGMGVVPPSGGDMKSMLTQGKVVMAGLIGDEAVLRAMRTNEAIPTPPTNAPCSSQTCICKSAKCSMPASPTSDATARGSCSSSDSGSDNRGSGKRQYSGTLYISSNDCSPGLRLVSPAFDM